MIISSHTSTQCGLNIIRTACHGQAGAARSFDTRPTALAPAFETGKECWLLSLQLLQPLQLVCLEVHLDIHGRSQQMQCMLQVQKLHRAGSGLLVRIALGTMPAS